MTYKDRDELVASLRELADFVEANGHKIPGDISFNSSYNFLYDDYNGRTAKEKARITARVLAKGGLVEKKHDDYSLDLIRYFGKIRLIFSINREKFCTKKVVGVKHHEARVIEAHTEEIVEWVCDDPVLAS